MARKFDGNQMIYASDLEDMYNAIQNAVNPLTISKLDKPIITITGVDLQPNTEYTLQLMRRSRKSRKTGNWIPVTENDGYRYLVTHAEFEEAPEWLPPVQHQIVVKTNTKGEFNYNISIPTFFVPFVKPADGDEACLPDTIEDAEFVEMSLVGLDRKRPFRKLHFTFRLLSDNKVIKNCANILAVNCEKAADANSHVTLDDAGNTVLTGLRTSIL